MRELTGKEIRSLDLKAFNVFGGDWMALCAGSEGNGYNAMTIAWGHFGTIWEKKSHSNTLPTAVCYVRPGRYTKVFMDKEPYFALCRFDAKYKKALGYLGSHSGRDGDKAAKAGLTPVYDHGTVYFKEAKEVYICRKLYQAPLLEEGFVDKELIDFNYPERDFHVMYVGEVVRVLILDEA